jgi:type II secretory ATPase GspE/PulE/Tfp pilus assembly ATPase PilB-like protein
MKLQERQILDLLVSEGYVTKEALKFAKQKSIADNREVLSVLLADGVVSNDLIGQAIAEAFKVGYSDLNSHLPPKKQVLKIPEEIAKKFRVVLFSENKSGFIVTTDNPEQPGLLEAVQSVLNSKKITISYSLEDDIDNVLQNYRKPLDERLAIIAESQDRIAPKMVDELLRDAIALNASDIHLEPQEARVVVRFRVDGIMVHIGIIDRDHYESILNRIKVMAHLRTDQHTSAQDGSVRYDTNGSGSVDIRVSIVPIFDGEKIVMRLLTSYARGFSFTDLGFAKNDQVILEEIGRKPFGMLLVVGPTGSGKTTSLYGLLKVLNRVEVNIATIEDPVEYKIEGVNHIQVNSETNLTFAKGLRSIVRQDPDIILVGEIRDEETAEIAVNAALTGHLLLSTFHANDASTAVPRLLDMGIEPFLLSSTLEAVVAQRLVRKICETCRNSVQYTDKQIAEKYPAAKSFFTKAKNTVYEGKMCANCGHTGYKGRTAVFEIIRMSNELQALLMSRPTSQQIWELARSQGARSMFEDGMVKVRAGVTTLEEIQRVVTPPHDMKFAHPVSEGNDDEKPRRRLSRKGS